MAFLEFLSLPATTLLFLTSLYLLLGRDWRWTILVLAIQYIGVFILVGLHWPVEMAIVKLVAGWMVGVVLGIGMINAPGAWQIEERAWPSGRLFRLFAALLVFLLVIGISSRMSSWLPGAQPGLLIGSLVLIGMGLLHLGLTLQPLRVAIALLTILSGFEIMYSVAEASVLVAGLLAGVNLGLALAGAYLLVAPAMEGLE